MVKAVAAFFSLYLTTLLLLSSTGLFNTFMGVRLTAISVSEVWIGALIAVYYIGLVFGARTSHKLIMQVGHIRAYAAGAAIVTVSVLFQILIDDLWVWLGLRFIAGIATVTQFMVLESWLNEQTENHMRGRVFAFYMVFSCLGTVLGQLALTLFPHLNYEPLVVVAICSVLCLVPLAVTRRIHPTIQVPAPINVRYYMSRVPLSLTAVFIAGNLTGAFYGLGPVFAVKQNLASDQVAVFVAAAVAAGLVAQWPLGWIADRASRAGLIRLNAVVLTLVGIPLWGSLILPYWALLAISCVFGIFQFTLYPLATAFANDNVEVDRRVGLSALLLMAYGLGAGLGPIIAGLLMRYLHSGMFFIFVSACAGILVAFVRPQRVTGVNLTEDAPTQFMPMSELQATPVVATLDPRVDVEADVSFEKPEEDAAPDSAEAEEAPTASEASEKAQADPVDDLSVGKSPA